MKIRSVLLVLTLLSLSYLLIPLALGKGYTLGQEPVTTWELLNSDYPDGSFWDVSFINSTHGWIVGSENSTFSSNLIILHTNDSGDFWHLQYSDRFGFGASMDVLDEQTVWVTGNYGTLFYTLDGGKTWNESDVAGAPGGMSTVKFINSTHGWTANNEVLYQTTNNGQSWSSVSGWNFSDHPQMMQVLSPLDIWAVGFGGIYHSIDGGIIWERSSNMGGWALSFVNDVEGWMIDDNRLAHTSNGNTWEDGVVPMRSPLYRFDPPYTTDIQFIDEDNGWIVGNEIKVLHTPDGGTNWYEQSVPSGVNDRVNAVDFINRTHGWAVGVDGIILRTYRGDTVGTRLWNGITDPLFLSIVGVVAVGVIVTVGGIIRLRRRRGKSPSLEIQ
ncbi:MAG: YCF48-related protein [Candidatus Thorarchaeota archaeon]